MKKLLISIYCIFTIFFLFLTACTNKNNTPASPWMSQVNLPGTNWKQAIVNSGSPQMFGQLSVINDNKIWSIVGTSVWNSTEGSDWNLVTNTAGYSPRQVLASTVYTNKIWVFTYEACTVLSVWNSVNGADWLETTGNAGFVSRWGFTNVVYQNKMWLIGGVIGCSSLPGFFNDVYCSSNGINWTQTSSYAAFQGRFGHSSVVYDNKMWVIGGDNNGINFNDVWYSSNGVDWYLATGNAEFSPRCGHTSVVYDNKIWVIGGGYFSSTPKYNDVWYSTDGVKWILATNNADFSPRSNHSTVVFNNKMWILGGNNGSIDLNDVWYSPY